MDPDTSLTTAEQALRDLLRAVMYKQYGAGWMDTVVTPALREQWKDVREQEARQRVGHTLGGVTDLSYAFLGDLVKIIQQRGHWKQLFQPILGPREEAFALFNILQTVRRPVDHARPLLPFEEDLISGIAGRIRNQVTIYLSEQDPDGDYYPRVERIEDSFGNSFTYSDSTDFAIPQNVQTKTTLRVGDTIMFRCEGTDPQGRALSWNLMQTPPGDLIESKGSRVDVSWTVRAADTGPKKWVLVKLTHEGPYHRNVQGTPNADAIVLFYYRVLPPSS
jgi:hypothetical protein